MQEKYEYYLTINNNLTNKLTKEECLPKSGTGWETTQSNPFEWNLEFFKSKSFYFYELYQPGEKNNSNTNFDRCTGIVLDFDGKSENNLTFSEAVKFVDQLPYLAFVVPGASGRNDSMRIVIPTEAIPESLRKAFLNQIINAKKNEPLFKIASSMDKTCLTPRMWLRSAEGSFHSNNNHTLLRKEQLLANFPQKIDLESNHAELEAERSNEVDDLLIENEEGEKFSTTNLKTKTRCLCPHCGKKDGRSNPGKNNAFFNISSKGTKYIYCSSEDKSYFIIPDFKKLNQNYMIHEKEILEWTIDDSEHLYFTKVAQKDYLIRNNVNHSEELSEALYADLVENNFVNQKVKVGYLCSAEYDTIESARNEHRFVVKVPAIKAELQDNAFIDKYLNETFGQYADTMRDWIAVFSYSNYKKLPHLVLIGGRGTGKSTFANLMASIFPNHTCYPKDLKHRFSDVAEYKLAVCGELTDSDVALYKTLKQLSGEEYLQVEVKYKQPFSVRNNVNLIITSNDPFPFFARADEAPVDEKNNQFFMFEFKKLTNTMNAGFAEQLKQRLGHYIKTESLARFKKLEPDLNKFRYSINVPITPELNNLYAAGQTNVEAVAEEFIASFETRKSLLGDVFVKNLDLCDFSINKGVTSHQLKKELMRKGFISDRSTVRKIEGKAERGFYLRSA